MVARMALLLSLMCTAGVRGTPHGGLPGNLHAPPVQADAPISDPPGAAALGGGGGEAATSRRTALAQQAKQRRAQDVTCTCATPGSIHGGQNRFECTNKETRWCGTRQMCYASAPFAHGNWSAGCADTCLCSTPNMGTAEHNQMVCSNGEVRHCTRDDYCYNTDRFMYGDWLAGCSPVRVDDYQRIHNGGCGGENELTWSDWPHAEYRQGYASEIWCKLECSKSSHCKGIALHVSDNRCSLWKSGSASTQMVRGDLHCYEKVSGSLEWWLIIAISSMVLTFCWVSWMLVKCRTAAEPAPAPSGAPPSTLGKPRLSDEDGPPGTLGRTRGDEFPEYWTNGGDNSCFAFGQMVYVDRDCHAHFERLLRKTYQPKVSQDRPCPKGTCAKSPGGCPCNKPGGDPGLPVDYRVRRVLRVENSEMWARYVSKRAAIQSRRVLESLPPFDPAPLTGDVAAYAGAFAPLNEGINECYLWHGTEVRRALCIAAEHFKIGLAGSGAGTMYGRGVYLAECSTKADEYCRDDPGGYYQNVYALLLCRVCMGKFYHTTSREPKASLKTATGDFDSTCGDRVQSAGTFREFVVYDADQLYPEYVVLYSRVHRADDVQKVAESLAVPLYTQVPVYWRNAHKDPTKEAFHEQYRVRQSTLTLLQKLVDDACPEPGQILKVLGARRVEQSESLNRYNAFKLELRGTRHVRKGPCRTDSAEEVTAATGADDLEAVPTSGRVLTQLRSEGNAGEQGVVSMSNLDDSLNEYLLWHGTTMQAAEAIAADDFRIPQDPVSARHGARFGTGAYFAEDVCKSLSYATEHDGRKFVLLCRVLCGDIYYTEQRKEPGADDARAREFKHSILAHPGKKGPRLFMVPDARQIYPEYIIEIGTEAQTPPSA